MGRVGQESIFWQARGPVSIKTLKQENLMWEGISKSQG